MGRHSPTLTAVLCFLLAFFVSLQVEAATIATGSNHAVAIKSDGTLWAWGNNGSGQLGDNTFLNRTIPEQVGSVTTWSAVAAGSNFTVALRSDGTLWAWGNNGSGQLGDGTTTNQTTPIQIGSATTWSAISAGPNFTVALRSDGTLWAWGNNGSGQLGDGTTTNQTTPAQIGRLTTWKAVAAGTGFTLALRSDGTLWAWGNNGSGQLGDGTFVSRTSPQQVLTGLTVVSAVISTVPEDGTTNVDVDARIKAVFSTEMDAATITTDTFVIQTPRSMGAHAQAPAPEGQITAPIRRAPDGLPRLAAASFR